MTRSRSFSLEEHRTRIAKVWSDFSEYRRKLGNIEKRIEVLEEKEVDVS